MSNDSPSVTSAPVSRPRHRWWIPATILGIGLAAQTSALIRFAENPTFAKMSVLFIWPATLFACLLWWVFVSRFSWRTRLIPVGVLAAVFLVLASVFRVDGSDGDMVPVISYRWTPTAAETARDYWKQQTVTTAAAPAQPAVDDANPAAESPPPLVAGPDDWADFRGPQRDGVYRGSPVRLDWDQGSPKELWRHPVGLGWSSFAVLDDYAITLEQRDADEAVVCYSLKTGEPIWIHTDKARFTAVPVNGGDGPHTTPAIDGDRTYSLGATGLLNCLQTRTGERIWSTDILKDAGGGSEPAANLEWGVSAAPLVVDDQVITIPGGTAGRSVISYEKESGKQLWAGGKFPASYCGARVEELAGVRQLLIFHGAGISGFSLDGKELWGFPWENFAKVNAAQPIKLGESSLLIGSGYGQGTTRLELTRTGDDWQVEQKWSSTRLKLKFNDAILVNGMIYGLDDGMLTTLDPETGKSKWKTRGFGYGQLLAVDEERFLVVSEEGDVVLVAADPKKFTELARFHAVDGTTWNHPVIARQRLLVRNGTTAVCYDLSPEPAGEQVTKN